MANLFRTAFIASVPLAGWALALATTTASGRPEPGTSRGSAGYERYCQTCHGASGRGDGAMAPYLETKPSDLTLLSRTHDGFYPANLVRHALDGSSVSKARGAMPDWGPSLRGGAPNGVRLTAAETVDGIVEYVESLQESRQRRVALCVFSHDSVTERCVETATMRFDGSAGESCAEILMCLNGATCARYFCADTAFRHGWRLESASRVSLER